MTLREALHYQLVNTAALTALVSTRIYSLRIPQDPLYPLVSFHIISAGEVAQTMNTTSAPARPRVQVDAWAKNQNDAEDVAIQISTALKDFSGTMGGGGGITVQRIMQMSSEAVVDYFSDAKLFRAMHDFEVIYE
jgi:hypothetical protein